MRSLVFSLLLLAAATFVAETGHACTCVPKKRAAEELELAAAVFSGKVVEIKRHERPGDMLAGVEAVFRVEKAWKGVEGETVSVFTGSRMFTCSYGFRKDRTYLVYARRDAGGRLSTSICSRTKRLKDARADLRELGAGKDVAAGVPEGGGAR
jgi:hypothetical protein